nr:hypothetical protein [Leptospira borgpetersenii]
MRQVLKHRSFRNFFYCNLRENRNSRANADKNIRSEGECQKEAEKLLSEKLKKGYMEGEERASSAPVAKKMRRRKVGDKKIGFFTFRNIS